MRVLFREPVNQPLQLLEIENELEPIRKLIGGHTEVLLIREDILGIIDEEGLLKGKNKNFYDDNYGWIVGNVIFCGANEDAVEFQSLTDEQIDFIREYIGFPVV